MYNALAAAPRPVRRCSCDLLALARPNPVAAREEHHDQRAQDDPHQLEDEAYKKNEHENRERERCQRILWHRRDSVRFRIEPPARRREPASVQNALILRIHALLELIPERVPRHNDWYVGGSVGLRRRIGIPFQSVRIQGFLPANSPARMLTNKFMRLNKTPIPNTNDPTVTT